MTSLYRRRLAVIFTLAAALALGACTNHAEPAQTGQPSGQENGINQNQNQNEQNPQDGNTAENKDPARLVTEFNALLAEGGKLSEAFDFLDEHIGSLSKEQVSDMLLALEDTQIKELGGLVDRFYEGDTQERLSEIYNYDETLDEVIGEASDEKIKALLTETRDSGYLVDTREGMFSPDPDYRVTAKYADKATEEVAAYIQLKAKESDDRFMSDAALSIGWDELLERALAAEAFTVRYPDSKRIKEVKTLLGYYKLAVFYGGNNTPLFDYDNGMMEPEAKEAYTSVLEKADIDSSPLLGKLKQFMEAAAKNNYKPSNSLDKLREELVN